MSLERFDFEHKNEPLYRKQDYTLAMRGRAEFRIELSDIGLAKASVLAERVKAVIRQELGE